MANVPSEYQPVTPQVPPPTPAVQPAGTTPAATPVPAAMPQFPDGSQQATYRQTGNSNRSLNWFIFALPIVLFLIGIFVIFIVFSILLSK